MIEYFQANLWLLWTLVCIICLILELTSGDFFIMCFSLGAIPAAIAAGTGVRFTMQIIIWLAFSVLCLLFVRPFALKYLHRNIEAGGFGRVKIDGDSWKAVSRDKADIPAGTKVKVIDRESIIITVERV